jgi:hypothetical protein
MLFTPAEPVRSGEAPPRTLTLRLTVAPGVWAKMPGMKGVGTERLLWAEELSWTLPLPQDRVKAGPICAARLRSWNER